MGIVSIGRNLVIRQALLALLVVALGVIAYAGLSNVADLAREVAAHDPQNMSASALQAAAEAAEMRLIWGTAVAALLMMAVSLPVLHWTIGRPIKAIADAIDRLAAGDFSVEIAGDTRSDELGVMARGLQRVCEKAWWKRVYHPARAR